MAVEKVDAKKEARRPQTRKMHWRDTDDLIKAPPDGEVRITPDGVIIMTHTTFKEIEEDIREQERNRSVEEVNRMSGLISRRDAENRLTFLVNKIEGFFADIRERNVDDSVCGLCEYDCDHGIDGSAFECLGFERDDCFKLKSEYREKWTNIKDLPSAQPQRAKGKKINR